jgi:hypothetical protein
MNIVVKSSFGHYGKSAGLIRYISRVSHILCGSFHHFIPFCQNYFSSILPYT